MLMIEKSKTIHGIPLLSHEKYLMWKLSGKGSCVPVTHLKGYGFQTPTKGNPRNENLNLLV